MSRPGITSERCVALFLLGLLAFNPPLLSIFSVEDTFLGVPVLFVYLFFAWAVLIGLAALTVSGARGADAGERPPAEPEAGGKGGP